ncbi:hypothetical protein D910_08064 [Dendroctonus ponderosae]|uniref:Uncharacterized protein n=1 Tax=Dendroctonus ponderosae TaxID=77166 RepID=U4UCD4_DENPD|nr:hypothetical protein D910_08064 [Dendroctonus ponderosae]
MSNFGLSMLLPVVLRGLRKSYGRQTLHESALRLMGAMRNFISNKTLGPGGNLNPDKTLTQVETCSAKLPAF